MKCPYCGEEMIRGYQRIPNVPQQHFTKHICTTGMCTAHAEPTHSGLLRNKSALTTIAGAEPTMRKTQV